MLRAAGTCAIAVRTDTGELGSAVGESIKMAVESLETLYCHIISEIFKILGERQVAIGVARRSVQSKAQ